jgi:hypothetical protein
MSDANFQQLEGEFAKVIECAWRSSSVIDPNASSEPNHVARFVHGAPGGIAAVIKKIKGIDSVAVQGTFCHQKPYAFWRQKNQYERRELADLLVVVQIVTGKVSVKRAMFVQVKMGDKAATTWGTSQELTVLQLEQRKLYSALPEFCLELHGRPTKQDTKKCTERPDGTLKMTMSDFMAAAELRSQLIVKGAFTPYQLAALAKLSPEDGGLVYAAVGRDRKRKGCPQHPWLFEDGRPKTSNLKKATCDVPFATALAEMVAKTETRFGVRSESSTQEPHKDWSRLVEDVTIWASRNIRDATKQKVPGVTLAKNASLDGVSHNVQGFLTMNGGALCGLVRFAHFGSNHYGVPWIVLDTYPLNGSFYPTHWLLQKFNRERHRKRWRKVYKGGVGGMDWPNGLEAEGGFGVLNIRIKLSD